MKSIKRNWNKCISIFVMVALWTASISMYIEHGTEAFAESETSAANPGNLQWSFSSFTADKVYEDSTQTKLNSDMVYTTGFANDTWIKEYLQQQQSVLYQFTIGTKLSDTKKGEDGASILYRSIGLLEENGTCQQVDMKVSLLDWNVANGSNREKAFVLFSTCVPDVKGSSLFPHDQSAIGVWVSDNVHNIKLDYTFFKAGTTEEIKVNGTFTQVDLDYLQYFAFEKETSNIKAVHKSKEDEKVWNDGQTSHITLIEDEPAEGWMTVQSSVRGLDANQEDTYRAGYVSSEFDTSRLSFQFGTKAALNTEGELKHYYFGVLPYSIASYEAPIPQKYVSADGQVGSYGQEIYKTDGNREIHYINSVYIPRSLSANYSSFSMTDCLNTVLDASNAYVSVWKNNPMGLEGQGPQGVVSDVTDWFEIQRKGQTIVVTAKESTIKEENNIDFFGNSYQVEIRTAIKDNLDLDGYVSADISSNSIQKKDGYYAIPNTVACNTGVFQPEHNGGEGAYEQIITNSNSVYVYYAVPRLMIEKKADDTYFNVGDTIHYEVKVSQTVKEAVAKNVYIEDVSLPPTIEIVKESVKANRCGSNQQEDVPVTISDNGVVAGKTNLSYGESLVLAFDAVAKRETSDIGITNIAKTYGDGIAPIEARETVYVSTPKLEVEKKVLSVPSNGLSYDLGDTVEYQVQVKNPIEETYVENLLITDSWEAGMRLKEESIKVFYCFGDDDVNHPDSESILPKQLYEITENSLGYTLSLIGDMEWFWGIGCIVVEYETEVVEAPKTKKITNTVLAKASNVQQVSDEETITVGAVASMELKKEINTKQSFVGEELEYTVTVENTGYYAIDDVNIQDISLPKGFLLKELKVYDGEKENGIFSWELVKNQEKGIEYRIVDDKDWKLTALPSKAYRLLPNCGIQVRALYTTDRRVTTEREIVNTATVTGIAEDGTEMKESDDASVFLRKPLLVIEKTSDKDSYGIGEKGIYTVTVSQPLTVEAQTMVVSDVFINDSLEEQTGVSIGEILSVTKIDNNGKEKSLTRGEFLLCEKVHMEEESLEPELIGTKTEHRFGIATGETLSYGERLIVQYEVLFKEPSKNRITNCVEAQGTNTDRVKTEHSVDVCSPKLKITKASDKKYYNYSEVAEYSVTVTQTEKAYAKDIILTDEFNLDDSFIEAYLSDIRVYDGKNQLLKKEDYSYQLEGAGYKLVFQKPLGYNESYKVVYSFGMYAPFEEFGEIVNTATVFASNAPSVNAECTVACYLCQLSIDKRVVEETHPVGDMVEYVVDVKNIQAKTDAMNVEVIDESLPETLVLEEGSVKAAVLDEEGHEVQQKDISIDMDASQNRWIVKKGCLMYGYTLRITFCAEATESAVGQKIPNRAYAYADNAIDEVMDMAVVQIVERQDYETTIVVTKKLVASDVYFPHGNPIFFITVEGMDIFGRFHKYNKALEFTEESVKENTDDEGYVNLSVDFRKLPMGEYQVYERMGLRYRLAAMEDGINGEIVQESFVVDSSQTKEDVEARITFVNEKYEWQQCSHTTIVTNKF